MSVFIGVIVVIILLTTIASVVLNIINVIDTKNIQKDIENISSSSESNTTAPISSNSDEMMDTFMTLNSMLLELMGIDNTPLGLEIRSKTQKKSKFRRRSTFGENRDVFGEQLGPTRTSRCSAMYHWAIYEAMIAANPATNLQHKTLFRNPIPHVFLQADENVAMIEAARAISCYCYPSMCTEIEASTRKMLEAYPDGTRKYIGIDTGTKVSQYIIDVRTNDGSEIADPSFGNGYNDDCQQPAGCWSVDPISESAIALGAFWGNVDPFVIDDASDHVAPPPPELNSERYLSSFEEVKSLGSLNSTTRSAWETMIGVFYGYDATPRNCAPPLLYNQLALAALQHIDGLTTRDTVKLMAALNLGLADTVIAAWKTKYIYKFWRPITAIRFADEDGNDHTAADPSWTPLGVPLSNTESSQVGVTPAFPEYVSGHASMGGFLAHFLRGIAKTDRVTFEFVSNEFDGATKNSRGQVRHRLSHTIDSLYQMERENGRSRIYIGVHFDFGEIEGIKLGRSVAREILEKMYGTQRAHDADAALALAKEILP